MFLDHMTTLESRSSCVDRKSLNYAPTVLDDKSVEGRLWLTLKRLAAAESNIRLFHTLIKRGLATNDVQNFSKKQAFHKRVNVGIDSRVKKVAMQSKLSDALAFASKLRIEKNNLKKKIQRKYRDSRSKGRRILADMHKRYKQTRVIEMGETETKIMHLAKKDELENAVIRAPGDSRMVLDGVNIFNEDSMKMKPEPAEEPMICNDSLKFNKDELLVLARGPKFMVRNELRKEDFKVELEKLVVKQKFDESDESKDDCVNVSETCGGPVNLSRYAQEVQTNQSY